VEGFPQRKKKATRGALGRSIATPVAIAIAVKRWWTKSETGRELTSTGHKAIEKSWRRSTREGRIKARFLRRKQSGTTEGGGGKKSQWWDIRVKGATINSTEMGSPISGKRGGGRSLTERIRGVERRWHGDYGHREGGGSSGGGRPIKGGGAVLS